MVEAVGPVPWEPTSAFGLISGGGGSGGAAVARESDELALEGVAELSVQLLMRPRGRTGPGMDLAAQWLVQAVRLINARRSLTGRPVVHIRVDPQDLA